MQKAHEYLQETTGLQRNFMPGSGSNIFSSELLEDSYLLFSAANLEKLEKPWLR